MHHAVAHNLRLLQSGDHTEHPPLLRKLQVGLKPHQVKQGAAGVLPTQLHTGPRTVSGSRVNESNRLHGAKPGCVRTTLCQLLNGHTTLVHIKIVGHCTLSMHQRVYKCLIFRPIEGTVQIVAVAATVVAGGTEHLGIVHALRCDNGRRRVIKGQPTGAKPLNIRRQIVRRQRTAGHHGDLICPAGYFRHHPMLYGDIGVRLHCRRHPRGELLPIHGQGTAGRHSALPSNGHRQRAKPGHLLLEQPRRTFQPSGL